MATHLYSCRNVFSVYLVCRCKSRVSITSSLRSGGPSSGPIKEYGPIKQRDSLRWCREIDWLPCDQQIHCTQALRCAFVWMGRQVPTASAFSYGAIWPFQRFAIHSTDGATMRSRLGWKKMAQLLTWPSAKENPNTHENWPVLNSN